MEQHIEMLKNLPQKVSQLAIESIVVPAANKMTASILQRNTNEGKNSDGSKRPNYNTEPIYIERKQFVVKGAFKPEGKGGFKGERLVSEKKYKIVKRKLKNGTVQQRVVSENKFKVVKDKPKSMYLPGGYEEFRSIQGRRTDIMNYELSGDLVKDFDLQSQPEQNRVLIGFRSEKQSKKRQRLEERFGKAFPPSPEEIQEYKDEVLQESKELQIKIMTNVI